ncbi:ARF GTPase activator (macronuclear) [Tetrahymena thermophila SB210]|uniref:ARF GTPase activator n=1 Tax=Tetrahymena thermophila (strain SB210) TaxID=312017 RepID=I7M7W6_TETTS|nr:ARF GTPase activator [Tetrahymena thermophila SB210]EAR96141.1 ARF GTPase activator [Tetrahymena thermophila SB210]|eukprot:XP_001016386.1 ARF GTPase activator [Tetrahymena thermophila SB210]
MNSFNSDNLLQELVNDIQNKQCFDCGAYENTQTSLNNGIFLCLKCSQLHRGFGIKISQIKSIETDEWNEYSLSFLKLGGNQQFKQFLDSYQFPPEVTIFQKYRSVAAVFYRKNLKHKVENVGETFNEEPPSPEEGIKILDLMQFQEIQPVLDPREILLQQDQDDMEKVKNFFVSAFSKAEEGVKNISKKIEETDFKKEIKELGTKVSEKSSQFSQSVQENVKIAAEKSKVAAEKTKVVANQTFSEISEKSKVTYEKAKEATSEGIDSLKKNLTSAWMFLKKKASKNEDGQQKSNNLNADDDKLTMDEKYEKQ